MSSILLDDLSYRTWFIGGEEYYGRSLDNSTPDFNNWEKYHYISRLLHALLTNDLIYLRIELIEQLIQLIGIPDTHYLLQQQIIRIIDDGGTVNAFLPNGDDNLLMNLSAPTLKFDAIESRLNEKYEGHFSKRLLYALLYNAERNKSTVDGSWLMHLTEDEIRSDFRNQRITDTLEFSRNYTNIIVKDEDIFPLLRLNQLNKSLIYQEELSIKTLSTEASIQPILNAKFSRFEKAIIGGDPVSLFEEITRAKKLPDLTNLYMEGIISMETIVRLRDNIDGKKFRQWMESEDYNREEVYKILLSNGTNIPQNVWIDLVRWVVPTLIGLINTVAGVAASAMDSFVVQKLINGWHPNFFLDNQLSQQLDTALQTQREKEKKRLQSERFGKIVGRNEPCPCKSGKKFKRCCGING